jgi:uncharacterized protein (DUF302 family)
MSHTASIIIRYTNASVEQVCARLPNISAKHKFGVLGVHDLKEKLNSKGVSFDRDCRVFEVCNPGQAQLILNGNITVSAALPCRVSVYREGERTVLATIERKALLALFGSPLEGADSVAAAVRKELVAMMEETCALH